jgi:hypothetical protein
MGGNNRSLVLGLQERIREKVPADAALPRPHRSQGVLMQRLPEKLRQARITEKPQEARTSGSLMGLTPINVEKLSRRLNKIGFELKSSLVKIPGRICFLAGIYVNGICV